MKIFKNKLISSIIYVIIAQIISLLATLVVSFVAPKFINVIDYGYWQLFLLYVSYIGLTRIGLVDGILLKNAGKNYKDLNHKKLSCEWLIYILFQVLIALTISLIIIFSNINFDRKFVYLCCCICIVIINSNNYFNYIFQAVNQTKKYSTALILENIPWFISIVLMVIFKIYSYRIIIIMYIIGHILSGIYYLCNAKEICKIRKYHIKEVIMDIKENIKCGIFLMISFFISPLIISSSRMIVDGAWGLKMFGYFSFSLTLANFLLRFISQISLVIFPAIKKLNNEKYFKTYVLIRNMLSLILPGILLLYFPLCIFIKLWLPQYIQSLEYLIYFLPICIFDGKMQLLYNTYFKVYRKEKLLFLINFITIIINIVLAIIFSYVFKNIYLVSISLLLIITLRSIISEILLSKIIKIKATNKILFEIILVAIFLLSTLLLNDILAFIIYFVCYLIYVFCNKNIIIEVLNKLKNRTFKNEKTRT